MSAPEVEKKRLENMKNGMKKMRPSATLVMNNIMKERQTKGLSVYKFGFGQSPFPVPEEIVDALRKSAPAKDYLPSLGLPELRQAMANWMNARSTYKYKAENVAIGPGTKQLIYGLMVCLDAHVIIPNPAWVSYAPQAELAGRKIIVVPTAENDWRMTPEALEAACCTDEKTKLLIFTSPNNPTGISYTTEELAAFAKVLAKHDVVVLADEIYTELGFDGVVGSLADHLPERVIRSTGLSKWCGAGGWRVGAIFVPNDIKFLLEPLESFASETFSTVASPLQIATITACNTESEQLKTYIVNSRKVLKALAGVVVAKMRAANITVATPDAAWYIMPSFESYRASLEKKGIKDNVTFANRLLEETGVGILAGSCFGRKMSELSARMCFVDFDGRVALDHANELDDLDADKWAEKYTPQVVKGLDVLIAWLRAE